MIVSLPQIAVTAVPEKVVSGVPSAAGSKPSETFSAALAQATQNSQNPAADSRVPGETRQPVNSSSDKANQSKSAPASAAHATAQPTSAKNSHSSGPADSPNQGVSTLSAVLPQPLDLKESRPSVELLLTPMITGSIGQTNPGSSLASTETAEPTDSNAQLISSAVPGVAGAATNPAIDSAAVPAGTSAITASTGAGRSSAVVSATQAPDPNSNVGSSAMTPGTQTLSSLPEAQPGESQQTALEAPVQPVVKNGAASSVPAGAEQTKAAVVSSDTLPKVKAATDQATSKVEVRPAPAPASSPVVASASDRKATMTGPKAENAAAGTETTKENYTRSAGSATSNIGVSPTVASTLLVSPTPNLKPASTNSTVSKDGQSATQLSTKPASNSAAQSPVSVSAQGSETGGTKSQTNSNSNPAAASLAGNQGENGDGSSFAVKTSAASTTSVVSVGPVAPAATSSKTDIAPAMPGNARAAGSNSAPSAEAVAQAEKQVEAVATFPTSALQSAKLVERLGQSEFRVGIQAGEFGNVDIRTSMARNQFTAQISVERGELSKVLAAELPSLQNRLSDQRLPNANIILQNQSSGTSAGFGQGSRQSQTMQNTAIHHSSEGEPSPAFMNPADASSSTGRLDVHM